jgi:hypothetical protein
MRKEGLTEEVGKGKKTGLGRSSGGLDKDMICRMDIGSLGLC